MESPHNMSGAAPEAMLAPSRISAESSAWNQFRRHVLSATIGTFMLTALAGTPTDGHNNHPRSHQQLVLVDHDTIPAGAPNCPQIPASYMHAAEQILDNPQDPNISVHDQESSWLVNNTAEDDPLHYTPNESTIVAGRISDEQRFAIQEHAAQENGLTVHDPTNYLTELNQLELAPESAPFQDYLTLAQLYTQQFGITLRVASADDAIANSMTVPDSSDLETSTAKNNLYLIVSELSTMPQEYIQLARLRTILIAANRPNPNTDKSYLAFAWMDDQHDTIVIGANTSLSLVQNTFRHEVEHEVDTTECGSYDAVLNDPGFAYYNNGSVYDANSPHPANQKTAIQQADIEQLQTEQYSAEQAGNLQAACAAKNRVDADMADISLTTDYAGTNEIEDEAETGKNLDDPAGFDAQLNPQTPHLRNKFKYLFARLLYYRPNIAKYFAAVAYRTNYEAQDPCSPHYNPALVKQGMK